MRVPIEDLKQGDFVLWRPKWTGHRFAPGPFMITKIYKKAGMVEIAEGDPPSHQFHYDSFFSRVLGTYYCQKCDRKAYQLDMKEQPMICRQCYGEMKYLGLGVDE